MVGPLDNKGVKGVLKEGKEITEKLNELVSSPGAVGCWILTTSGGQKFPIPM